MKKAKKEKIEIAEDKFSKKQLVNSKTFINDKDLLNALLKENELYSKQEVNELIENFKKGKVN